MAAECRHDALLIDQPAFRGRGMVKRHRLVPIPRACLQGTQVTHGIGDIGGGVEARLQAWKGLRMVQQIDLHAANINRAHATGLSRPHFLQRLCIRSSVAAITGSIIGPGPGLHAAIRRAAPGFNLGNRAEEPRRQAGIALGRCDGCGTKPPRFGQGGRRRTRGSDARLARRIGGGRLIGRRRSGIWAAQKKAQKAKTQQEPASKHALFGAASLSHSHLVGASNATGQPQGRQRRFRNGPPAAPGNPKASQ